MTTALTPIITQLELDRDRFKVLINGTVDDTVQLEFRVEKSIAGQIRDRIDGLALDLITAVDNAQTFANNAQIAASNAADRASDAQAAQAAAELARNQALAAKSGSESARDESETYRDQAKAYRDEAVGFTAELSQPGAVILKLNMVSPMYDIGTAGLSISPNNFSLIGQAFDGTTNRLKLNSRRFEMYDTGTNVLDEAVEVSSRIDDSLTTTIVDSTGNALEYHIGNVTNSGNYYAARFSDIYIALDEASNVTIQDSNKEYVSEWVVFKFDNSLPSIGRPTISSTTSTTASSLTPTFTVSAPAITGTGSISNTYLRIIDENGKVVYDKVAAGTVTTFVVPHGALAPNKTYRAQAQYSINSNPALDPQIPPTRSPFSAAFTFTTEVANTYMPYYRTKSKNTTSVIDVESAAVHRVSAAANKTLTLSKSTLPSDTAQNIVVFVEDSGGVITWPTEVSWAGGNEPTLGTTWTLVNIFWTGSMWIGMEGSKR